MTVLVDVVVPTRNSVRTIRACLDSLRTQEVPCRVIVVDNHSEDSTREVAGALADVVLVTGPERSAQRNAGARAGTAPVVGFIDSDMILAPGVLSEALHQIQNGASGVIVPEHSVGQGYWSAVRRLERSFYIGVEGVEAARFFRRDVFETVGGFDESLRPGTEDWDLSIAVGERGRLARTDAVIEHDEGRIGYRDACRKKGYYALSLRDFRAKHGSAALKTALDRPYFHRPWKLLRPNPILGGGVLALKAGEATAVLWSLVRSDERHERPSK